MSKKTTNGTRSGVSEVLYHLDSSTDTTDMVMVGGSGAFCHMDPLTALYHIINIAATQ